MRVCEGVSETFVVCASQVVAMLAQKDSTNVVEAYTGQETIQNEAMVFYDIVWR